MTSTAEHRRPLPTDAETILNALPNPVLLVGPDGRIVGREHGGGIVFRNFRPSSCNGIR